MSTHKDLELRIQNLLEQKLGVELGKDADGKAQSDAQLGLDSMALLELSVSLEKEFNISLDDDDLINPQNFQNLDSLARLVARKSA